MHFYCVVRPSPSVLGLPQDLPQNCQVWCEIQAEIWPENSLEVLNSHLGWCIGSTLDTWFCNVQLNYWADSIYYIWKGTQQSCCSWGWATYTTFLGVIQELKQTKKTFKACLLWLLMWNSWFTLNSGVCWEGDFSSFSMARLVWKVLLDVIFLELVRHLELRLLYNIKPAFICVTLSH